MVSGGNVKKGAPRGIPSPTHASAPAPTAQRTICCYQQGQVAFTVIRQLSQSHDIMLTENAHFRCPFWVCTSVLFMLNKLRHFDCKYYCCISILSETVFCCIFMKVPSTSSG